MNPAFLDEMSWEMAEVYGAITDQIIINLARLFPYVKTGGSVPESAFRYQARMLAQMGKVNAQTMQIIRNNLSDADAALSSVLEATIIQAIKDAEPELYKGAKKGIFTPPAVPVLSPNQTRAFQLYYAQAADKLNLVNTVMLESTQSAYMQCVSDVISEFDVLERINRTQTALDVAAGETITGVSSWNQAVKHATDRLKEGGIVGFIDHGNHRWSAEAYVAMDVRTTVYNTGRAAVWETNESFGNDLYIVSYHNGARPGCYDWQNKVISANNVSGETVDLDGNAVHVYAQNETSYGQAAGLFGINCKHYPTPFIPGVSAVRGQVQDKEANDKQYEESQEQRRLERNLREEKRDLEMLKAQGADEDQIRAQRERVRAASDKIDDFCDETGRVRRRNRESVYTKREFPDPDKYDPAAFAKEQQQRFDDYWKNGGTQTGRTFGTMTPNEPIVPNPPPVAPATPQITPAQNVAPQATQPPAKQYTLVGNTDKLRAAMSPDEYNEFVGLAEKSETAKLYETYGDKCARIERVRGGGVYRSYDVVEFDYEKHAGVNKYSTLAHEMAHMFDTKIGESSSLTFNEVNLINKKCSLGKYAADTIRVRPSSSDQFLTAMRKDKATLEAILSNPAELARMRSGTWRNASSGVQDAMDGFFGTQDKNILPWGHGNKYYNRVYNRKIKDLYLEDKLAEAYNELGFGLKNKTAVKMKTREYETAGELWANVLSALTCGGEELEAFREYMPATVEAAISIIGGL